jgi:hypothetical protein
MLPNSLFALVSSLACRSGIDILSVLFASIIEFGPESLILLTRENKFKGSLKDCFSGSV